MIGRWRGRTAHTLFLLLLMCAAADSAAVGCCFGCGSFFAERLLQLASSTSRRLRGLPSHDTAKVCAVCTRMNAEDRVSRFGVTRFVERESAREREYARACVYMQACGNVCVCVCMCDINRSEVNEVCGCMSICACECVQIQSQRPASTPKKRPFMQLSRESVDDTCSVAPLNPAGFRLAAPGSRRLCVAPMVGHTCKRTQTLGFMRAYIHVCSRYTHTYSLSCPVM